MAENHVLGCNTEAMIAYKKYYRLGSMVSYECLTMIPAGCLSSVFSDNAVLVHVQD